ncbi:MAG: hypothetical protein GX444_06260 [Myxococcales bacterium]|nr:hypothetical protein [Myxococcales bacterium]
MIRATNQGSPRRDRRGLLIFLIGIFLPAVFLGGCATAPRGRYIQPTPPIQAERGPFFAPQTADDPPLWGIRSGIVLGIHPAIVGFAPRTAGGPRGLLRVGYEENGRIHFINFFALSPVTPRGKRGMSELEDSPTDGRPGILINPYPHDFHERVYEWAKRQPPPLAEAARIQATPNGAGRLAVVLRYEKFHNGARVYLLATLRADRPQEIEFQFFTEPDCPPLKMCVLSSTFGNLTRLRELLLADRIMNAKKMWPDYQGNGFAEPFFFPLRELARNRAGDVIFAARPDEDRPWEGPGFYPHPRRLTQYFRVPREEVRPDLRGLVNGRFVFWKTTNPVPGGIAFENVALVEPFHEGARLIYGYADGDPTAGPD